MDHIEYMLTTDEKLMRVKFYNTEPGTSEMDDLFDLVIERLLLYLENRVFKYDPSIDIYNDIIIPGISLQHFIFLNVRRTFYNLKKVKSTPILGYIFRKVYTILFGSNVGLQGTKFKLCMQRHLVVTKNCLDV